MILKIGKNYQIKVFNQRPTHWNRDGLMDVWMGKIVTIRSIAGSQVRIKEDSIPQDGHEHWAVNWFWAETDFEKISEVYDLIIQEFKDGLSG